MNIKFKDHFSGKSNSYSKFRPVYPDGIFSYLSSLTGSHERAWDCGTGSGQSAIALANYYAEVIGTDASENQIKNAKKKEGVIYKNEQAEKTSLDIESVDLISVAQALHWFNIDMFVQEVKRVLKPDGVLAAWTYGLHQITSEIDDAINYLYGPMLEKYWPPERTIVEEGYKNINLPMKVIEVPDFQMEIEWELSQLIGYLHTWSAVKKYEAETGENPVDKIYSELAILWKNPERKYKIKWPLTLKVWRKIHKQSFE